jgi:hypothetical protein
MAEGLGRQLRTAGLTVRIFYDGWDAIKRPPEARGSSLKSVVRRIEGARQAARLRRLVREVSGYQALIVVGHVPSAFMRHFLDDDRLRDALPDVPIVLYDLVYLPTRGDLEQWLRFGNPQEGIPDGGHFGLERYDWYLCVSLASETPLNPGSHPYSHIGIHLDDGSLYPEQREFRALVDFARNDHAQERTVQITALRKAEVPFETLHGRYSIPQIREIYRASSAYFVAHRESFGLPICEIQACGGMVLTPYSEWAPSHWQKEDLSVPGPGRFSENFAVYENDAGRLAELLREIKGSYNSRAVRERFLDEQPEFYYGNPTAVAAFVENLASKGIGSRALKR